MRDALVDRKHELKRLLLRVPASAPLRYADHVEAAGVALFECVCELDLEGIVGEEKARAYVTEREQSTSYRYKDGVDEVERAKNRSKSTVRSKVEHVFAVMKLKFGFVKLHFRGLQKNATQLFAVCALANLYLARKKLLLLAPASPGAKVADHGRAAQAGGRPGKTESERLHRPSSPW